MAFNQFRAKLCYNANTTPDAEEDGEGSTHQTLKSIGFLSTAFFCLYCAKFNTLSTLEGWNKIKAASLPWCLPVFLAAVTSCQQAGGSKVG